MGGSLKECKHLRIRPFYFPPPKKKMNQQPLHTVHFMFIGAGASSILTLLCLEQRNLLSNKSIVMIDPDKKNQNDRTFCFWEKPNNPILNPINHLVSKDWNKFSINQIHSPNPENLHYYHIKGLDLYRELDRLIAEYNIIRIFDSVTHITSENNLPTAHTSEQKLWANYIFDSRPPQFNDPEAHQSHLHQSFYGLFIELEHSNFEPDTIDLMGFNVPQNNQTQFMYVLPFSEKTALVELTRFGAAKISAEHATPILNSYIKQRFGDFKILETEQGSIPMSTAQFENTHKHSQIISIGARAGAIKPSTGYAFKSMLLHAHDTANSISKQNKILVKPITRKTRFKLYDRLLLKIIEKKPNLSKNIFETLFLKNNTSFILKFLDEKTSIGEDIKIFSTLPFQPFFNGLIHDIKHRISYSYIIFFFTLFLIFLQTWSSELCQSVSLGAGLIGLFSVGIPHGALDHLLETKQIHARPKLSFVLGYVSIAAFYLIFWLIVPTPSLIFFILFSIWHFGSTDIFEWELRAFQSFKSWFWGTLVFAIILFGHWNETQEILGHMNIQPLNISKEVSTMIFLVASAASLLFGIFQKSRQVLITSLTLMVSMYLPLLTSFGLYFIGLHSIRGWFHIQKTFNTSHTNIFKKSLPFTAGAFLLFIGLVISKSMNIDIPLSSNLVSLSFIFVACISLPHVLSMTKFYRGLRG